MFCFCLGKVPLHEIRHFFIFFIFSPWIPFWTLTEACNLFKLRIGANFKPLSRTRITSSVTEIPLKLKIPTTNGVFAFWARLPPTSSLSFLLRLHCPFLNGPCGTGWSFPSPARVGVCGGGPLQGRSHVCCHQRPSSWFETYDYCNTLVYLHSTGVLCL